MQNFLRAIGLALFVVCSYIAIADVYRWVDDDGNVHYADCPPEDCEFEQQAEPVAPSEAQRQEAERIARETIRAAESISGSKNHIDTQSGQGPAEALLPDTASSKYLKGGGAFWQVDLEDGFQAAASIVLEVRKEARRDGVYVEARFPNPGAKSSFRTGALAYPGQSLTLRGKLSPGYKCGVRYLIRVLVYPSELKLQIIDDLVQPTVIPTVLCDLNANLKD